MNGKNLPLEEYLESKFEELEKKLINFVNSQTQRKKYLTAKDLSILLSVSLRTIYQWNTDNVLSPIKINGHLLYDSSAIEELLRSKK